MLVMSQIQCQVLLQGHSLDVNPGSMNPEQILLTIQLWCLDRRYRGVSRLMK